MFATIIVDFGKDQLACYFCSGHLSCSLRAQETSKLKIVRSYVLILGLSLQLQGQHSVTVGILLYMAVKCSFSFLDTSLGYFQSLLISISHFLRLDLDFGISFQKSHFS